MTPKQWQYLVMGLLVFSAVNLQTVVAARLPLPGPPLGLTLVVVVGIGLAAGTTAGAASGFSAGLLLDLMPPAQTTIGISALLLLIVGALAGRITDPRGLAPAQLAGLTAALASGMWLLGQGLLWLLGDPVAPLSWLVWFVLGTTLLGIVVVPAVTWVLRRMEPGRRRRRRLKTASAAG